MSDPNAHQQPEPDHIAQLRKDAEIGRNAPAQLADRDRTIELLRAGVDPSDTFGGLVAQRLGTEDVTPERVAEISAALRSELGMPEPTSTPPPAASGEQTPPTPPPAPTPEQTTQGQEGTPEAAHAAAAQVLADGQVAPTPEPPPKSILEQMQDTFQNARGQGLDQERAAEAAIGQMFREGASGNPTVVWDDAAQDRFEQEKREAGHGAELAGLPSRPTGKRGRALARQRGALDNHQPVNR